MSEERDVQAQETQEETNNVEINEVQDADVSETVEAVEGEIVDESAERIYELEKALADAQVTIKEQQEGVLRTRADMENVKRRAEAEVEKARKFALERFAGELLPVVDNLERALDMADDSNEAIKPMLEGVDMTLKSFISTLDKFELKQINPQGEAFNPELHQAMSMQESADFQPNTVMAVMQKGYQLNGRLIRPAMVMVSRAPEGGVDTQA